MNITVLGAGATGGYFGGRLAKAGVDVTFLVREKRAAQLQATGLVIKSMVGDIHITNPKIATDAQDIKSCDLVILGIKNYHLAESLPQIRKLADKGAKVLPLLNGVEHYEILQREIGKENVIGGVCKVMATLDPNGYIIHTGKLEKLIFGELDTENRKFCQKLQHTFAKATFKAVHSHTAWDDVWEKYAFINVFSGTTTAGNITADIINANEASRNTYRMALTEMKSLADAAGVKIADDFVKQNMNFIGKSQEGSTSSMHQDKKKGLPLEVESLQGAAVRLAKKYGIEIPVIETLYGLIKPYEKGN